MLHHHLHQSLILSFFHSSTSWKILWPFKISCLRVSYYKWVSTKWPWHYAMWTQGSMRARQTISHLPIRYMTNWIFCVQPDVLPDLCLYSFLFSIDFRTFALWKTLMYFFNQTNEFCWYQNCGFIKFDGIIYSWRKKLFKIIYWF